MNFKTKTIIIIFILLIIFLLFYTQYQWSDAVAIKIQSAIERDCAIVYPVNSESVTEHPFWEGTYLTEEAININIICEIPSDKQFEWECRCAEL